MPGRIKSCVVLITRRWLALRCRRSFARNFTRSVDRLKEPTDGVTLAFGSDLIFFAADETRGTWTISQIDSFVEAGIPPRGILLALTTNAAQLLGVDKARGAIKTGQFADIIATPENPLDNIATLKQVNFVMKNGKVFKEQ